MDNRSGNQLRDGALESLWQERWENPGKTVLESGHTYDVLVIGGGITGLTSALLLAERGHSVVLAEAYQIGFGATGGTSAHLNTFFDATYPEIEKGFGADAAKLVALGGTQAMQLIAGLVDKYQIDCDFDYKDGYLFAQDEDESRQLDGILAASQRAGVDVVAGTRNTVSMPFEKSVIFKRQGQFHPVKYLHGLAAAAIDAGVVILENTIIESLLSGLKTHVVKSGDLEIRAGQVIYATHLPPGINLLDFKCAAYRSYVIAVRLEDENYPDHLAYDLKEPYHYLRTHRSGGMDYLLVGGEDHKTGHGDPEQAFRNLEAYVSQYYNVASVPFRWSSQYYVPDDGLPYIGSLPLGSKGIYIATGYNGNGMMFGTLAGQIITNLIEGEADAYAELFSPARVTSTGTADFIKENADAAWHFVADRFKSVKLDSFDELAKGEGKVVEVDGERIATYRDEHGEIHALNPVCTHAGCTVTFNSVEKSWDCPCHGGRFDTNGRVITGPPRKDLAQVNLDKQK